MQKFFQTEQQYPDLRDAAQRKLDYNEIYDAFSDSRANAQSERCLQCGVPFCQVHCPLENNIPDWLRYTAEGRLKDAYEMAASTNTFPEICGRICPQDRLCEGNCVVQNGFGSITIGSIEKYITDTAWKEGWVTPFAPTQERSESVGIIGSGPAGMAAAEQLRKAGLQVHLYDRHDRAGGLLMYGIPNFKLDKDVVLRRITQYEQSGITFHQNVAVGDTISLEELRERHDAVLIATGVYKARELSDIEGNDKRGIHKALDYLITSNKRGLGDTVDELSQNANGRDVVVIGGGDTAMDCVRTAIRQGAKSVECLYRRDRKNMPGSAREVKNAEEEGVTFNWLSAPARFLGNGKIEAIDIQHMRLGDADASGRRFPVAIEGNVTRQDSSMIIKALGFEAEDLPHLFNAPSLQCTRWGTLDVNRQMMTSLDGVFAAGDIVRGASLVVWAIRDGRDAAANILNHINARQVKAA